MTEPNTPATPPAGWHPDPWVAGHRRYWTGSRWTSDTFPDAGAATRWGQAARPESVGAYGPPPTTPASPPPPPPAWGTAAPAPAPAAPEPSFAPAPASESRPRWPLWVVGGAAAAIVLAALAAVLLLREPTPSTRAAAAAPSASPSASPSAATPSPSPSTGGATPAPTTPSNPPSPGPSGSPPAPTTPGSPPGAAGSASALLADLVVRQRDVPSGYLVATIDGGDRVEGETTLDLCDATYPSESLRTDRLQTAAVDVTGCAQLSTEAVVYRSAAATAQAFDELRAAASRCSATSRGTDVTANPDASWGRTAGVDRLAFRYTRTDASGNRTTGLAVYLKRGDVFLGVYFPNADRTPMPVEDRTTVPAIVKLFEERLLRGGASSSGGGSGGIGA